MMIVTVRSSVYLALFCFILNTLATSLAYQQLSKSELVWPTFIEEPSSKLIFYNSTEIVIPCKAKGNPKPSISWIMLDPRRSDKEAFIDLRSQSESSSIRSDGSLIFAPYSLSQHNYHTHLYRCIASNPFGSIMSRNVHIKTVTQLNVEAKVDDQYAIESNTGILYCKLHSHLSDYVSILSWIRSDGFVIKPYTLTDKEPKYIMFPSGELHIVSVQKQDGEYSYRCQILNHITAQDSLSITSGRLIVTESQGKITRPRLLHKARLITVRTTQRIVLLPCSAHGNPKATIEWYKQSSSAGSLIPLKKWSKTIRQFQDGTLVIVDVDVKDEGEYACVASNTEGQENYTTRLEVIVALKADIQPKIQKVSIGFNLIANCSVTGHPIESINWFKNGQPILFDGDKFKLLTNEIMAIKSIEVKDDGIYQCLVSNQYESIQSSTFISIASEAPILLTKPSNIVAEIDSRVSLKCVAKGNPLPQIIWTSFGLPVHDADRMRIGDYVSSEGWLVSFINISRLSVEEGGKYECKAVNDFGEDSSSVWINVVGPPFIKPLKNQTVIANRFMLIDCPYSVHHLSSVSWFKDNQQLPLNRRQTIFKNGTLLIQNLYRPEDEGEYKCTVTDEKGRTAERNVFIKILVSPTIMPFSFGSNLQEGMRASVTCTVTTGDVPIDIKWFKDGEPIKSSKDAIFLETVDEFISTLIFKPLKQEHNGHYSCVASNEASSNNHTVYLSVDSTPQWQIKPVNHSVIVGQSLTIDCQAKGKPEPRVIWKKSKVYSSLANFKTVISGSKIQALVNGSLYFVEVNLDDNGAYMCEASNDIGSPLSTVIQITVYVPAHFTKKYQSVESEKGNEVILICNAFGELPIQILWSKDGQILNQIPSLHTLKEKASNLSYVSKLLIRSTARTDTGLYTCLASNEFGKDEKRIELIIKDVPDPPYGLKIMKSNSQSLHLQWQDGFNGNSLIKRYILIYKKEAASWKANREAVIEGAKNEALIKGLSPLTRYNFRLRAENTLGKSEWSQIFTATTEGEVPDGPPRHVQVTAIGSKSLKVSWQSPIIKHHNTISGFYIGYKKWNQDLSYIFKIVKINEMSDHFSDQINNLEKMTKYSIVVQAFNEKGAGPLSEEVLSETTEHDLPLTPVLSVTSVSSYSIQLKWSSFVQDNNPVSGYVIRYKKSEEFVWNEIQVSSDLSTHLLSQLDCGSKYHISIASFNSLGRGEASESIMVKTFGSLPKAPEKESLFVYNTSELTINLNAWLDADCLIDYFSIQYKKSKSETWTKLNQDLFIADRVVFIKNLEPATWYDVWFLAKNGAGSTEAEYKVGTLTKSGDYLQQQNESTNEQLFSMIVPVVCALAVLITLIIFSFTMLYCYHHRANELIEYSTTNSSEHQPKSEFLPMNDIAARKASLMDHFSSSHHSIEEGIYLPAPYASSRLVTNLDSLSMIDKRPQTPKHFISQNILQNCSLYDLPHNRESTVKRAQPNQTFSEFYQVS